MKKPKIIIVTGEGRSCAKEAIFQVLKPYFKIGQKLFLLETDLTPHQIWWGEKLRFLIKHSSLPILVVTHVGDIPFDKNFFAGELEKTLEIRKLAKGLPSHGYLILNFDDETVREIKDETNLKEITFGLQEGADFRATDIKLNTGTNFKINYKGNIVPIWLEKLFGKEQIYSALVAAVVGTIFDFNLVEISQALKDYQSLPGKMRLIEGIKNSWILDDSESASVFSMTEALAILGKLSGFKRKIAVLGDIIGIGKFTIEAHEAIGERVARTSDLLFTFGQRAKFIAQGACTKGMSLEKIFQFDTIEEGKLKLQEEIKEGDLILVDGSKEMKMGEIIEAIKTV
ncbi:MAG: Mur ligase family protein [Patescibacteria group bacterium]|nr:Mur ligase family protein [Patescibacteria group bacterium]